MSLKVDKVNGLGAEPVYARVNKIRKNGVERVELVYVQAQTRNERTRAAGALKPVQEIGYSEIEDKASGSDTDANSSGSDYDNVPDDVRSTLPRKEKQKEESEYSWPFDGVKRKPCKASEMMYVDPVDTLTVVDISNRRRSQSVSSFAVSRIRKTNKTPEFERTSSMLTLRPETSTREARVNRGARCIGGELRPGSDSTPVNPLHHSSMSSLNIGGSREWKPIPPVPKKKLTYRMFTDGDIQVTRGCESYAITQSGEIVKTPPRGSEHVCKGPHGCFEEKRDLNPWRKQAPAKTQRLPGLSEEQRAAVMEQNRAEFDARSKQTKVSKETEV